MKLLTKKNTVAAGLGAVCVISAAFGIGMLNNHNFTATADDGTTAPDATTYFYDGLVDANGNEYTLAKKFYDALNNLAETGDFKDGVVDCSIDDIVTSNDLKGWVVDGKLDVPKAFSAARDAFLTDHPEVFYIDFYKLTISVGYSNGVYSGYIDCGREANAYRDNGLNSLQAVETAISAYEAKINEIVDYVNGLEQSDVYSARDVFLAREVNKYLAENVEYDYVAYENRDDENYIAAAYINTAYGGLVEGKAVCGGFSTAYKAVMDKLGIPCITVNGYTKNKDSNGKSAASNVYHMWNYVWLENPSEPEQSTAKRSAARTAQDGRWYSVDVTWNSSANNKYRYAVMNSNVDADIHVTDGVISSSGYELKYPTLSLFSYGSTGETDGLVYSITYNREEGDLKDDTGEPLQCNYKTVSYNGKSAMRLLEEDGLYIAYRDAAFDQDDFTQELKWNHWVSLATFLDKMTGGIKDETFYIQDNDVETRFYDNTSVYATQFAVFDIKPDGINLNNNPEWHFEYFYSDELVNTLVPVEIGNLLVNQTYGTYTPAPYIQQSQASTIIISDSMRDPKITDKVVCAESKAIVFEITYDEPLHVLDTTKPIEVSFVSDHPNTKDYAKFFPLSKDDKGNDVYVELVQRPKNSGDSTLVYNTLRFKFGPSLMYEHDQEGYHFSFNNVGSAKIVKRQVNGELESEYSNKTPNPAYYNFGRQIMACPACFNYDGRLWIECCAAPTLVTNSDLSEMDFLDENGESTFSENERSQMMLVAERANTETIDTMLDEISDHEDININKEDIKTSETYDIKLQMCNKYPTISDGSYVKIALGFPEGYGPNDEGVTFKLFHRKHLGGDNYIIEEVPCVVTQFGIVATVTSFSPYMVAVVDADKATEKTVYASIEGKGGKLTKEDGQIKALKQGDTCTYTIQPDSGYQIYKVTLNGENVADRIADGKLTLTYDQLLRNNELEIQYIADEAAARFAEKEIVEPVKMVVSVDGEANSYTYVGGEVINTDTPSNVTGIIIGVVAVVVVAVAAIVAAAVIVKKRKN